MPAASSAALDYDQLYKIVLVGDAAVGKTNLLAYYTATDKAPRADGTAPSFGDTKSTIGVEFATMIVNHPNGTRIKAQIWDTAGQERYRAITASHYKRAAGALLVYDVTNRRSFENAKNVWLSELKNSAESDSALLDCLMLVGNKTDITNRVAVKAVEQQAAADGLGLLSKRTSAKTGLNVDEAFESLILRVYEQDGLNAGERGTSGGKIKVGAGGGSSADSIDCC